MHYHSHFWFPGLGVGLIQTKISFTSAPPINIGFLISTLNKYLCGRGGTSVSVDGLISASSGGHVIISAKVDVEKLVPISIRAHEPCLHKTISF